MLWANGLHKGLITIILCFYWSSGHDHVFSRYLLTDIPLLFGVRCIDACLIDDITMFWTRHRISGARMALCCGFFIIIIIEPCHIRGPWLVSTLH